MFLLVVLCSLEIFTVDLTNGVILENKIMMHGWNLSLDCRDDYSAEIEPIWWFNGHILSVGTLSLVPADLNNVMVLGKGHLFVSHIDVRNQGRYNCILDNKLTKRSVDVYVEIKPNVALKGLPECPSTSMSYEIECIATGANQNVTFTWYVNNVTYQGVEHLNTFQDSSTILYHPNINDISLTCRTSGRIPESEVEVIKKISRICDEEVTVIPKVAWYGKNVVFDCGPKYNKTSLIDWNYKWADNVDVSEDRVRMTITNVRQSNGGNYTCMRGGGKIEITQLRIDRPNLTISESNNEESLNSAVFRNDTLYQLDCRALAVGPPANISWLTGNRTIDGQMVSKTRNRKNLEIYDYVNRILYVPFINDTSITCLLETPLFSQNTSVALSVNQTSQSIDIQTVQYGSNVSLFCDLQTNVHLWQFRETTAEPGYPLPMDYTNFDNSTSQLIIDNVKMKHQGYYGCYQLHPPSQLTYVTVEAEPVIEIDIEGDPPSAEGMILYRYKTYNVTCRIVGSSRPIDIAWRVNDLEVHGGATISQSMESTKGDDLIDVIGLFIYHPSEGDCNVSCSIDQHRDDFNIYMAIKEVVSVESVTEIRKIELYGDTLLQCDYPGTPIEMLRWFYPRDNTTQSCQRQCCSDVPCLLKIENIDFEDEGKYECYHGLEVVKRVELKVTVEMKVFLMPNRERSYPGTIRIYESSDYSFVCISNSTDEIKDIQWSINGVQQKENVKIKNESNNHIYQLRSTLEYNPSSRHQTISCSSRGLNIIKEEKVNIKFILPFLKIILLCCILTFCIVTLPLMLVVCCRRTNQTGLTSIQMMELLSQRNSEEGIDKKAWRRSMLAYSRSSGYRFSVSRMSRRSRRSMGSSAPSQKSDNLEDQYEMVIADSYGNRVIPFRHLCLAMKLQEGRYLDRWVGTMRQKYASKTGVLISSVSGLISEDKQFRWDMFVKNVIDIPRNQCIALVYGVGMQRGSLYLVQEFLAVESLRDYFELKPETQTKQSENIFKFAMDIVKGMSFLSKHNFCHPGISIKKVILTTNKICKLYDFCLKEDALDKIDAIIRKEKPALKNFAPETLLREEYVEESDVWSVAVALWEVFSFGDVPFKGLGIAAIQRLMTTRFQFPQPADCHELFYDVLVDCWTGASERPTIETLQENLRKAVCEYLRKDFTRHRSTSSGDEKTSGTRDTYGIDAASSEDTVYESMDG